MSLPLISHSPEESRVPDRRGDRLGERVSELQARIQGMQRDRWEAPGRPVSAGLARLLPQGTLRTGAVYTVDNSTSLLMSLLGAAAADGGWAGVVGLPDFGAEAATGFGIDLARLVLVPTPGDQWLAVTGALVDVLPFVVVQPARPVGDAEAGRLGARLRQTGCTLLVAGSWPQAEASLHVTRTRWEGVGAGHGYLSGRDLTVEAAVRAGSGRRTPAQLHLPEGPAVPDAAGSVRGPVAVPVRVADASARHPVAGHPVAG
ncbi:hypothetical protein [Cryobacterium soli]|jgi:hypothetical protein|uniref:hypothetical protein n=1 Tax=Cryobacterium soli TaxID=2220095 RepID=UPI0015E8AD30|nr:hypothetical protein [Cryobacterium soli]